LPRRSMAVPAMQPKTRARSRRPSCSSDRPAGIRAHGIRPRSTAAPMVRHLKTPCAGWASPPLQRDCRVCRFSQDWAERRGIRKYSHRAITMPRQRMQLLETRLPPAGLYRSRAMWSFRTAAAVLGAMYSLVGSVIRVVQVPLCSIQAVISLPEWGYRTMEAPGPYSTPRTSISGILPGVAEPARTPVRSSFSRTRIIPACRFPGWWGPSPAPNCARELRASHRIPKAQPAV